MKKTSNEMAFIAMHKEGIPVTFNNDRVSVQVKTDKHLLEFIIDDTEVRYWESVYKQQQILEERRRKEIENMPSHIREDLEEIARILDYFGIDADGAAQDTDFTNACLLFTQQFVEKYQTHRADV